jgi:hypothetical protein
MKRVFVLFLLVLAASVASVNAQVLMRGDIDLWTSGSRLRMYAERIENQGDTATDLLRFRAWATDRPWGLPGEKHSLGIVVVGRLQPQQGRWDVYRSTRLSRPDRGWWHVTLTLEERAFDENGRKIWLVRDVAEFDEVYFYGRVNPFWPWD